MTKVVLLVPIFLFSLCVHEYAHGWVAMLRGDDTAKKMGRLTLNPMAHADLLGTIFLPIFCLYYNLFFIGWAKPVPVDSRKLKNGLNDMALVAAAGPISNVLIAIVASILLGISLRVPVDGTFASTTQIFLVTSMQINLMLAVFNLIPVPPLDGFRIIQAFLPPRILVRLWSIESYLGIAFLLIIYFVPGGFSFLAMPVSYLFRTLLSLVVPGSI